MYEQEIKLTATDRTTLDHVLQSELVQRLNTNIGNQDATRYIGDYYDTDTRALAAKRYSLRARREGERWRAALKYGGVIEDGFSRRHELEADIGGWLDSAAQLPPGVLKDKVLEVIPADAPLSVMVRVDMLRSIRNLDFHGTAIELSADQATISGTKPNRQVALYEVELEFKRGEVERLLELGALLRQQFPLIPSTVTKHRMGLQLG